LLVLDGDRRQRLAGLAVHQLHGVLFPVPAFAPLAQGGDYRKQVAALVGEAVFVALAVLAHVHTHHYPVVHQPGQAVAEDVLGDAQVVLEIHKAAGAQHGLLDHQQGPPVTDLIEGAGHRTAHFIEAFACHGWDCTPERLHNETK